MTRLPDVSKTCSHCGETTMHVHRRYMAFKCTGCGYTVNSGTLLDAAVAELRETPHRFRGQRKRFAPQERWCIDCGLERDVDVHV